MKHLYAAGAIDPYQGVFVLRHTGDQQGHQLVNDALAFFGPSKIVSGGRSRNSQNKCSLGCARAGDIRPDNSPSAASRRPMPA